MTIIPEEFHIVGDTFWYGSDKVRYLLVDGRPWQAGDRPYDYCRHDADGVTYCWREEPR